MQVCGHHSLLHRLCLPHGLHPGGKAGKGGGGNQLHTPRDLGEGREALKPWPQVVVHHAGGEGTCKMEKAGVLFYNIHVIQTHIYIYILVVLLM